MADFGLKIYNTANTVQIGQDYRNLMYISKGSVVTTTPIWTYNRTFLTLSGTYPMLALGQPSNGGYVTVGNVTKSGSNWTFEIICSGVSATIPYWYFDQKNVASSSTHGLRVWKGADLVFDQDWPVMKVEGFLPNIFINPATGTPIEIAVPAGKTYAVVTAMRCATNYVPPGNPDAEVFYMYGTRLIPTGIQIQRFAVEPARFVDTYNKMAIIIVDVTDL